MQLTVLCLLGVAAGAYAQAGVGFGIVKSFNVSLLPLGSVEISKGFGIGVGTDTRRRRDAPRDPPRGPRLLIARRPGSDSGDRPKPGPGPEDLDGPRRNGQGPSGPRFGFGPSRHPLPPKRGQHWRKSTTTQSPTESSSASSSEASNESSSESSNQASSEASNESSSQANNEASNESGSNESNESSSDASNESDSNSSNESS